MTACCPNDGDCPDNIINDCNPECAAVWNPFAEGCEEFIDKSFGSRLGALASSCKKYEAPAQPVPAQPAPTPITEKQCTERWGPLLQQIIPACCGDTMDQLADSESGGICEYELTALGSDKKLLYPLKCGYDDSCSKLWKEMTADGCDKFIDNENGPLRDQMFKSFRDECRCDQELHNTVIPTIGKVCCPMAGGQLGQCTLNSDGWTEPGACIEECSTYMDEIAQSPCGPYYDSKLTDLVAKCQDWKVRVSEMAYGR